jgi:hypothetical protein
MGTDLKGAAKILGVLCPHKARYLGCRYEAGAVKVSRAAFSQRCHDVEQQWLASTRPKRQLFNRAPHLALATVKLCCWHGSQFVQHLG